MVRLWRQKNRRELSLIESWLRDWFHVRKSDAMVTKPSLGKTACELSGYSEVVRAFELVRGIGKRRALSLASFHSRVRNMCTVTGVLW